MRVSSPFGSPNLSQLYNLGKNFGFFSRRFPDFLSLVSYTVVAYIVRHANNDGRPINDTFRLKR